MTLPLISCIMPTYNRRAFVPHAIHYFQRQTYENKELIILDDGDDPVGDLIPSDPRIRYERNQKKLTLGAKRNLACELARGDLIAHFDDDDWYAPWRLSYQVEALLRGRAAICGINKLLYYDLCSGRAYRYCYPCNSKSWLAGSDLLYSKEFWVSHRFADISVGEDGLFLRKAPVDLIILLENTQFAVHMIHERNGSPKQVSDNLWRPMPARDVGNVMGEDWAYYQQSNDVSAFRPRQRKTPPSVDCVVQTSGGSSAQVADSDDDAKTARGRRRVGVSVIVPHGGVERLPHLAASLANLAQLPSIAETIVVDMGVAPVALKLAHRWRTKYVFVKNEGAFERARALNIGSGLAVQDLLLWKDNDLLMTTDFLERAVDEMLRRDLDFLIPYSNVDYLSQKDSRAVMEGVLDPGRCEPIRRFVAGRHVSGGAGLVRKAFVDRYGGVPEQFRGWGGEDNAWAHKAAVLGRSGASTMRGQRMFHLYHPDCGAHEIVHARNPHYNENLRLLAQISAVTQAPEYLRRFPPPPFARCPWALETRIVFVVGSNDDELKTAARMIADGLRALYSIVVNEITLQNDGGLREQLTELAPDAVGLFGLSLGSRLREDLPELAGKSVVVETVAKIAKGGVRLAEHCGALAVIDDSCNSYLHLQPYFALPGAEAGACDLARAFVQPLSVAICSSHDPTRDHEVDTSSSEYVASSGFYPVWVYWEGTRPDWIEACQATILEHGCNVRILDRDSFDRLWDRDRDIDIDRLHVAHRADYIRAFLLARYGGLWLDSDCVVMRSLAPLLELLRDYDFIAHKDRQGFYPNGFIGARERSEIAQAFYHRICAILRSRQPLHWISLGGEPLTETLRTASCSWREIACELIQPVCWSRPDVFFKIASRQEHERSFDRQAYCYMMSNTEVKKYERANRGRSLMQSDSLFRFLLEKSGQCPAPSNSIDDPGGAESGASTASRDPPQETADIQRLFRNILNEYAKLGDESLSGPGSGLVQTAEIRRSLPYLLQELDAQSLLDAPCGDFHWMKEVKLGVANYIGVDILEELVEMSRKRHGGAGRRFIARDILRDDLPRVDVILCRDFLVHLSYADIQRALWNFKRCGARYLLMTTFPRRQSNCDIATGDWRPVNFEVAPFNLPAPIRLVVEGCTEAGGRYSDKSLGLWRLCDIA